MSNDEHEIMKINQSSRYSRECKRANRGSKFAGGTCDNLNHTMIITPISEQSDISSPKSFVLIFTTCSSLKMHCPVVSLFQVTGIKQSISQPVKEKYACLSEEAIKEIKTFPAIFATENHHYGKTDDDHSARLGYITSITIQDNGIRICASYFWEVPQQRLNDCREYLAIQWASSLNEFNRTHWTIKRINLFEVLKDEGLFPC